LRVSQNKKSISKHTGEAYVDNMVKMVRDTTYDTFKVIREACFKNQGVY
jgi:hypothetical protein